MAHSKLRLSRDKTLSLLTGKTPGRLNVTRDFVLRVLIHGVIPVIALLGAQFPQTVRQIFSWLNVVAFVILMLKNVVEILA